MADDQDYEVDDSSKSTDDEEDEDDVEIDEEFDEDGELIQQEQVSSFTKFFMEHKDVEIAVPGTMNIKSTAPQPLSQVQVNDSFMRFQKALTKVTGGQVLPPPDAVPSSIAMLLPPLPQAPYSSQAYQPQAPVYQPQGPSSYSPQAYPQPIIQGQGQGQIQGQYQYQPQYTPIPPAPKISKPKGKGKPRAPKATPGAPVNVSYVPSGAYIHQMSPQMPHQTYSSHQTTTSSSTFILPAARN